MKLPNPLKPCPGCIERRERINAVFNSVVASLTRREVPTIADVLGRPDESKNKKKNDAPKR